VPVAEVLHDRAALPEGAVREALRLDQRRQVGRVLGEELGRALLAPDVDLFELEPGGADEDPDREVIDARLENAQRVCGHGDPPVVL